MSALCKYCGGPEGEEGAGTGVCEGCYYGMRLEPEVWEARMRELGKEPKHRGGCIVTQHGDGVVSISCRDPYEPPAKE